MFFETDGKLWLASLAGVVWGDIWLSDPEVMLI